MKKILIILFLINILIVNAQTPIDRLNLPSPVAGTLGQFGGGIPSLYTGQPNIEIPLYTLVDHDIKIPISLLYNTSIVKVNNHPGWVGLGWNLSCGGAITRVVRDIPDEYFVDLPTDFETGYYHNFYRLNTPTWYSPDEMSVNLWNRVIGNLESVYEVMADEFYFSFLGYDGKFFLNENGQWIVICDKNIQVELDSTFGFLYNENADDDLQIKSSIKRRGDLCPNCGQRYFNRFILTTPDGMKYTFGGKFNTEYSTSYRNQIRSELVATTWYLCRIQSPLGHNIYFRYQPGDLICSLYQTYSSVSTYVEPGDDIMYGNCGYSNQNFERDPANGQVIFPVYLESIQSDNEWISFSISNTNELRYDLYDLNPADGEDPNNIFFYDDNIHQYSPYQIYHWKKLDKIEIKKSEYSTPMKRYKFEFTDALTERLRLLHIRHFGVYWDDIQHCEIETETPFYEFEYYLTNRLPSYCQDKIDHWGFYNGYYSSDTSYLPGGTAINYYETREPDVSGDYLRSEVLKSIKYPTGGFTEYIYEPHKYSKYVNFTRDNLINENGTCGGLRISKIIDYFDPDDLSKKLVKNYYYLKNFKLPDTLALSSSGILSGKSQYYWGGYYGKDLYALTYHSNTFSSSSLQPYTSNAFGNPIGYSEVVEVTQSGNYINGYTKYTFTNYEQDIWGVSHMDEPAITFTDSTTSVYNPMSLKEFERGKLTSQEFYNISDQIVKKTTYKYSNISSSYYRATEQHFQDLCLNNTPGAGEPWFYGNIYIGAYASAYKVYQNNYFLERTEDYEYDLTNNLFVLKSKDYTYNSDFRTIKSISENSSISNDTILSKYYYAFDFCHEALNNCTPEASGINNLYLNNRMDELIETTVEKNNVFIKALLTTYVPQSTNNLISVPYREYEVESDQPFTKDTTQIILTNGWNKLSFDSKYKVKCEYEYDLYGNLLSYTPIDDITSSYVYALNFMNPFVASKNISSATINSILSSMTPSLPTTLLNVGDLKTSQQRNEWKLFNENLRNNLSLSNGLITTYTFKQFMGMTSKTDSNGFTTYFEYDCFGRLICIRDNDYNIIKTIQYHYKNNLEN